ncbi:DUF1275 family protein [Parapedobacter defluvii]|uniref:DUF1275 family protein n=1 Tax=Parapedobacter defluvii TaxID=2045106 RepID=A0ABQ1M4P5_9SPHI|nr:YoaK family protein [Parapedobacter defluvii]GGC32692.1 DUF1275 family protein [Parapedobacter defluvii]
MLRHKGKGRTYSHNLKLASLLSGVAGMVNICGVLALGTLTTNVTGHFAYFAETLFLQDFSTALVFMIYILFFLLGAFVSGLLTESVTDRFHTAYLMPLAVEIVILCAVTAFGEIYYGTDRSPVVALACALLFAMGLQNALVTRVSQSVVRTTHLTGLFTDLGIELAQRLIYRGTAERTRLRKSIFLKLMIIMGFFLGGIAGGYLYQYFQLRALLLPVGVLLFTLGYDQLLFRFYRLKRKLRSKALEV